MPCFRQSIPLAAAALILWAAVATAEVQTPDPAAPVEGDRAGSARLLDVPFLAQTEDLCGGAAAAMVLRYWGERQVYAEDFAALLDRGAAGIRTNVLAADVARRGWLSFPLDEAAGASGTWIREQVDRGRPVVALVAVAPNRYHYVVIVAWTEDRVIAHDPAEAPFRVMAQGEFDRAWAAAGRWALLILPADRPPAPDPVSRPRTIDTETPSTPCTAIVEEMVQRAGAGDVGGAEEGLLAAIGLCPRDPGARRELAGIRFLQSRWGEASMLAEQAARLEPGDEEGWNLLGTSRYLDNRPRAALEAWNRIGRPTVDRVLVDGARRTRHPVIAALVDLPPRTVLTPERFGRAERRLQELPSAAITRLTYRPFDGGLAEIEAGVVERDTLPRGVVPILATAARAWLRHEIRVDAAAPARSGEAWTVAWRWWESRPRLGFALAVPSPSWLPGVATVDAFWERSSYNLRRSASTGEAVSRTARRRAAFSFADWATSRIRWQAGAAFDRWGEDSHLSLDAALDLRFAADLVAIGIDGAAWAPLGSGAGFATSGVSSAWRSTRDRDRAAWTIDAGLETTTSGSPFDLWPGAGTGHARTPLLRAHPLLDAGVVSGPAFGRRLAHLTLEYQHPIYTGAVGSIRLAAFADTAQAWKPIGDDGPSTSHTDIGAGIRLGLPGEGGTLRVDVARGLRDRAVVLSAGWQPPWPGR